MGRRGGLSIGALCSLARRRSQTYHDWRSDGLVTGPHGPPWGHGRLCDLRDAVEFFSLAALIDAFGTTDGRACWKRLASDVITAVKADEHPVWIIYPIGDQPPQLVRSAIELAPVVGHGQPVRVTNIRPAVGRRLGEFRVKAGLESGSALSEDRPAD